MPYRKIPLVKEEIYHIYTRSIAGFKIFNSEKAFRRMLEAIDFYSIENPPCKYSLFLKRNEKSINGDNTFQPDHTKKIVRIFAYCLMPTHIHLIVKQFINNGISLFLNLILKSYSKYFNAKYNRKGPLWEGRFKNVLVETNEQFLHLTRYIHLNPTSASLVSKPEDWEFSSYREYIGWVKEDKKICDFSHYLDMDFAAYKKFVEDHIDYQRKLEQIKHLTLESL